MTDKPADQSTSSLWTRSKRSLGGRGFTFLQHVPKASKGEHFFLSYPPKCVCFLQIFEPPAHVLKIPLNPSLVTAARISNHVVPCGLIQTVFVMASDPASELPIPLRRSYRSPTWREMFLLNRIGSAYQLELKRLSSMQPDDTPFSDKGESAKTAHARRREQVRKAQRLFNLL
jgi:hypothetical protein